MTCPHCGSKNVAYAHDTTTTYVVIEFTRDTIWIEPEGAASDEAYNQRLICTDCNEEIDLPENMTVASDRPLDAPVADPDEETETQS